MILKRLYFVLIVGLCLKTQAQSFQYLPSNLNHPEFYGSITGAIFDDQDRLYLYGRIRYQHRSATLWSLDHIIRYNSDFTIDTTYIYNAPTSSDLLRFVNRLNDTLLVAGSSEIRMIDSSGNILSANFQANVLSNGVVFDRINNLCNHVYADRRFIVSTINPLVNADTTEFYFVHRLFSNGLRDTTFKVHSNYPIFRITQFEPQEFYLSGVFTEVNAQYRPGLARLDSSGNLDTSFNMGLLPNSLVVPLYRYPDGRVIVAGRMIFDNNPSFILFARIFPNGSLDSSFAFFRSHPQYAETRDVFNVEPIENGKFIAHGIFQNYNGHPVSSFVVIDSLGEVDTLSTPSIGFYIHPNTSSSGSRIDFVKQVRPGIFLVAGNFDSFDGHMSRYRLLLHRSTSTVNPNPQRSFTLRAYPNPSSGLFYFDSQEEIKEIRVLNTYGQLILVSNENLINLAPFASGLYIYEAISQSGHRATGRLLKAD